MKIAIVRNTTDAQVVKRRGRQNQEFYEESDIEDIRKVVSSEGFETEIFQGDISVADRLGAFFSDIDDSPLPYLAFNLAYGVQGEDRYTHIPSILEQAGIPYIGSGPHAHTVSLDKYLTKLVLERAGLPTPPFQLMPSQDVPLAGHMSYPVIVKPQFESTSFGIVVVEDDDGLHKAVKNIVDTFHQPALIEQYIEGREVNCGVLGNHPPSVLPVTEIDFGKLTGLEAFLSYEVKRDRVAVHVCPAQLSDSETASIKQLSVKTVQAIGCLDYARVDFRIDRQGKPWILELNSMAALHKSGSLYYAAQKEGMNFRQFILQIVGAAVKRYSC